ncbi:hypothetical protein Kisp02_12570 [Kineosporia sp. NBRC 101731]|nr:hypothetical protein Kisp02_12570 [Kineosporia sp. NBRC 101731]
MPANSWQKSTIRSKSQRNWYRVNLKTRGYLYALLGSLPADYNLRLYDAKGKQLNVSDRAGTKPESIGRMLDAGTYYLLVGSSKGHSKSNYELMARVVPRSATIGVLTQRLARTSNHAVGEIVNVSDSWLEVVQMDVSLYDSRGKLLKKYKKQSNHPWIPIAPGARVHYSAFVERAPYFERAASVKVVPHWQEQTVRTRVGLKVSGLKKTTTRVYGGGAWSDVDWSVKVTNTSSRTAHDVNVFLEGRDKRGVVVDIVDGIWQPNLAPGATKKFVVSHSGRRSTPVHYTVRAYETS